MTELPLTGERTVPDVPEENYWFRRHEAAYRFARERVRGRVLDVGSGEGYGAAMLAETTDVVATELDETSARHARSRYRSVPVVRGDACHLPFRSERFDAIVAMQVL